MRPFASSTSCLMPGSVVSSERVAISPSAPGICSTWWVVRAAWSGKPIAVKGAGAASVSHMPSIAASFIFWCSLAR